MLPNRQNYSYAQVTSNFLCVIYFVLGIVKAIVIEGLIICFFGVPDLFPLRFSSSRHFLLLPIFYVRLGESYRSKYTKGKADKTQRLPF